MAIDQLLWIHDMDLDTVIKNFYHKYIKKDQRSIKVVVSDEEIKAFWEGKWNRLYDNVQFWRL